MVNPRTSGPFIDIMAIENIGAQATLTIPCDNSEDGDETFLNTLWVSKQTQEGNWGCPCVGLKYEGRKRQLYLCDGSISLETPDAVIKHAKKHICGDHCLGGTHTPCSITESLHAPSLSTPAVLHHCSLAVQCLTRTLTQLTPWRPLIVRTCAGYWYFVDKHDQVVGIDTSRTTGTGCFLVDSLGNFLHIVVRHLQQHYSWPIVRLER